MPRIARSSQKWSGLGAATALYLAIQWVALGIVGNRLGSDNVAPLAQAAAVFAGAPGRTVMIVAASISMLGYLSANILSTPRAIFAYARDGLFEFNPEPLDELKQYLDLVSERWDQALARLKSFVETNSE